MPKIVSLSSLCKVLFSCLVLLTLITGCIAVPVVEENAQKSEASSGELVTKKLTLKTAFGMSFISMLSMETAMNLTNYTLTGGARLVWWVIPIA